MGKVIVDLTRGGSTFRNPSVVRDRRTKGRSLTERSLPKRSSIKPRSKSDDGEKFQTDRLRPLRRFLVGSCGRSWNTVYSEICKSQDYRTLMGDHLLSHVEAYITLKPLYNGKGQPCGVMFSKGDKLYPLGSGSLYVDKQGVLRQVEKNWVVAQGCIKLLNFKQIKEKSYIRRPSDNVWFELLFSVKNDEENDDFTGYECGYSLPLEWMKAIIPFRIYNSRLCRLRTLSKKEKKQLGLK
jgi:hypothetical protein